MDLRARMEMIINKSYKNTAGIIVKKNGETVYESYMNDSNSFEKVQVYSVTKSITGILLGIAIDKGLIKSIDDKVLSFFPDYVPERNNSSAEKITIRDMITMTAPYRHKEFDYTKYFTSDDWVMSALSELGGNDRIGDFRYAALIGPDILSAIIAKKAGMTLLEFANKNLFRPLEIDVTRNITFKDKDEQLEFYNKRNQNGWVMGPSGVNTAGWGLSLTTAEMARIGQLMLQHGIWKKDRIVSEKWILESTSTHSHYRNLDYGYLLWLPDSTSRIYAALGDGGNTIYINEDKKLVVAISCLNNPKAPDRLKFIHDYIEHMFA